QHPEQRAELRANPALIPNMIEESVRWDPALQGLLRTASQDAELAGTSIPAGASMFVSFASANTWALAGGRISVSAGRWDAWACEWPLRSCCRAWAITSCCWNAPSAPAT